MSFLNIDPSQIHPKDLHQFIIGSISPRPIALVSTISPSGKANLAPYSFFNAVSSNPPMLIFSSNLKSGKSKEKDTLKNIQSTRECVVNIVNYNIMRQMTLTSVAYDYGVSEFEKSGLTPLKSEIVKSFRVKESPVQFECTIKDIIALGNEAGAANLIICNILKMHVVKSILNDNLRRIDPNKLDVVGRLGRSNYVRVNGDNIIPLYQSVVPNCIGFDGLPRSIQLSEVLTGNELGELAAIEKLPTQKEVWQSYSSLITNKKSNKEYHKLASELILQKEIHKALMVALIPEYFFDS